MLQTFTTSAWSYQNSCNNLLVTNVKDKQDLQIIETLRQDTFGAKPESINLTMKKRDKLSFHILVSEKNSLAPVGCCRLTLNPNSEDCDSGDFFDLSQILEQIGQKVELSYICVADKQRQGLVIRLILSAVAHFCEFHNVRFIFGAASLLTTDFTKAERAYDLLTRPQSHKKIDKTISPLLRFYTRMGASVLSRPIFDPYFLCFDFLMLLDLNFIQENQRQRIKRL